ncbi:DUF4164 domain-containing protein [Methylobacterium sp. SyP6R]|uniref:DUF4164 domain-containing protein n=1 Tax=Methylobacterium sp. SyP6R TaxID=2718876 RepID=UPI001F43FA29|nr:DUF4164 domain-containing protein [Methylobacterium sp. SyP6R]MCF4124276.1 DUF4164 domain-containing protein [Methylobacterium sp. SyP6R]
MTAAVEEALRRLEASVSLLESAVTRRLDAERSHSDLETELEIMRDDRARLAAELDGATARLAEMQSVTEEVDHRLGRAIGTVEGVLGRNGERGEG